MLWECCFGVMYGEWYGVCDFIVLSVVEVCVGYGGINVIQVCIDFCVNYGVGVCVIVCGVVCAVVCFLRMGIVCCVVMRVVGGVPLWVECVFAILCAVFLCYL